MTKEQARKDLVVLVADLDIEEAFRGLLSRHDALQVRPLTYDIFRHPSRDSGCFTRCHEFLRPRTKQYRYALVLFDRDGCGREQSVPQKLEEETERRLAKSGWEKRAAVVIPVPELEIWVWSDSPNVDEVLGWKGKKPGLRTWLADEGLLGPQSAKPADPKKALQSALRHVQQPRSAALYRKLAEKVGLERCCDFAFLKLKKTLHGWFPVQC